MFILSFSNRFGYRSLYGFGWNVLAVAGAYKCPTDHFTDHFLVIFLELSRLTPLGLRICMIGHKTALLHS